MANVRVRRRGKSYEYQFETAPIDGKRKSQTKSGFNTKREAELAGIKAYNEYISAGQPYKPNDMSYSDYLDYWFEVHVKVNLKYNEKEKTYDT